MKLPTIFLPEKSLESKVGSLLKTDGKCNRKCYADKNIIDKLKRHYSSTSHEAMRNGWSGYKELYSIVEQEVSALQNRISYSLADIEGLYSKIFAKTIVQPLSSIYFPVHISALINSVITEQDEMKLTSHKDLGYFGVFFKTGEFVLKYNSCYSGDFIGASMSGGKITIEGNAGYFLGRDMTGGEIIVEGNTGDCLGLGMTGGKITVNGSIWGISASFKRGMIIQQGKTVRQA
ncbi:MAG: hypothetical protein Q8N77_05555 [Nanoarchaeota archaeon]|nr:hypothetical protein [Nanoarchaeota archaeon]